MKTKSGLTIGGRVIVLNDQDLQSDLKYVLVPVEQQCSPAFSSGDMGQVLSLADDLSVEIVMAMTKDSVVHAFEDVNDLADNVALRKGVIAAMRAICAGDIDADYVEAGDGVPPTLGYLAPLEAILARDGKSGKSILTEQAPFRAPDTAWVHLDTSDSWAGFGFIQNTDMPLSQALQTITPFRGECAGALQLAIMVGCLNNCGAGKLDALTASYGPAFVGVPFLPAGKDAKRTATFATNFISQSVDLPEDYARGSVIAVPGDYLYFKNKDDYHHLAEAGGWQGENCIYMGQDNLGNPHYSGLGLAWKTEFAFRMFLTNAYLNDVNTGYLEALEKHQEPESELHIVEHPQKQVRFVKRALMRLPEKGNGVPPDFHLPVSGAYPLNDDSVRTGLESLDFQRLSDSLFEKQSVRLGSLMTALSIGDRDFVQPLSAPFGGGPMQATLGNWRLVIDTVDTSIDHPDADDLVHALISLSP